MVDYHAYKVLSYVTNDLMSLISHLLLPLGCRSLLFAEKATRGIASSEASRTGKNSLIKVEACLKAAKALRPTLARRSRRDAWENTIATKEYLNY